MMKVFKSVVIILLVLVMMAMLSACGNKDMFDTVYTYDRAIIHLPNGEIVEGKVDSWRDYADADQLQIKVDGIVYLVHSSDVALIVD